MKRKRIIACRKDLQHYNKCYLEIEKYLQMNLCDTDIQYFTELIEYLNEEVD